jgi:hypothetical protein
MQLTTIFWNGQVFLGGDTNNWGADAQSCFYSRPQFIAFDQMPPPPQPLAVKGFANSTADPSTDGNRRAVGRVAGVVFGT